MSRPKPFLTYVALCAAPLLLLAGLNYWNGIRSVDSILGPIVQDDLNSFNAVVDEVIGDKERAMLGLAMTPEVQRVVATKHSADTDHLHSLLNLEGYFRSLTLFDRDRQALSLRIAYCRPANLPAPNQSVWGLRGNVLLDKPGSTPATIEYTAPIYDENGSNNVGALVGVLDLDAVFSTAAQGLQTSKRS